MKSISLAVGLVIVAGQVAFAEPPKCPIAPGTWWNEWNSDRFEVDQDGKASWFACALFTEKEAGRFSAPDEHTLCFKPDDTGKKTRTWKSSIREGLLVLQSSEGIEQVYRRETVEERWGRAADVFVELLDLRSVRPSAAEGTETAFKARDEELVQKSAGLVASLTDGYPEGFMDKILPQIKKRRPERLAEVLASLKLPKEAVEIIDCRERLARIGAELVHFEEKFKKYPKSFVELKEGGFGGDPTNFDCPAGGKRDAFVYVFPEKGDATEPDAVVAYERDPHSDGSHCVLWFNGRVMCLDAKAFEESQKK